MGTVLSVDIADMVALGIIGARVDAGTAEIMVIVLTCGVVVGSAEDWKLPGVHGADLRTQTSQPYNLPMQDRS